jgi:hypothetical protein
MGMLHLRYRELGYERNADSRGTTQPLPAHLDTRIAHGGDLAALSRGAEHTPQALPVAVGTYTP